MDYPEKILRGISGKFIDDDGILSGEAFQLDKPREDGQCEISITWVDEPQAFDVLMKQRNALNEIQFVYGAAEIKKADLDEYMKPNIMAKQFSYERRPSVGNPYHGNFLVLDSLDKGMKKLIKQRLAMLGNAVIRENPYVNTEK